MLSRALSKTAVISVVGAVDEHWDYERRQSGLSTGEGLINAVRDPFISGFDEEGEQKVIDEGVQDKRLLVVEEELARVLRVMARMGNTLSSTLRGAFDEGRLSTMTKNSPQKATNAHISLIGHITIEELRRELSETDLANGFANRFLWLCATRSKSLPDGGTFERVDTAPIVRRLRDATTFARESGNLEISRDEEARELWHSVYDDLTRDVPGLLGSVTARGEALTMRLALVYAILDSSPAITRQHLEAALEVWRYCYDSAAFIFGDRTGDHVADRIWDEVQQRGELGRSDAYDLFHGHERRNRITGAISVLVGLGRLEVVKVETGGRPSEVLRLRNLDVEKKVA